MTFAAAMRIGTLETLLAAGVFAVVALRSRRTAAPARVFGIGLEIAERGRSRRVEGLCPLVVGRAADADILVMDPEVSRRHACFEADGETIFLSDLHSSNGTFLNGRRVTDSIEVRPGDEIDVGAARITFIGTKAWT